MNGNKCNLPNSTLFDSCAQQPNQYTFYTKRRSCSESALKLFVPLPCSDGCATAELSSDHPSFSQSINCSVWRTFGIKNTAGIPTNMGTIIWKTTMRVGRALKSQVSPTVTIPDHWITPDPRRLLTIPQKLAIPTVYANTADSIPGGAILAKIAEKGIACKVITQFSKTALPSKNNTVSGIPIATFHLMIIIKSTIDAREPITMVTMSTGLNLQVDRNFS
mmetsp:Transcript_28845/g.52745  ORF Transcript_28845/g.52745 Transcript_28845/m.52745 type:complete len:220 (+) Transcript_28845:1199-1858(+)